MPGIPTENLEDLWSLAKPYLKQAIKRSEGRYSLQEIKYGCQLGEYVLWVVRNGKAAVVLEVSDYTHGKQCEIIMIGGEYMDTWIAELEEIESWCSRIGCNRMILTGRMGWQKILPEYKVKAITMVKSW